MSNLAWSLRTIQYKKEDSTAKQRCVMRLERKMLSIAECMASANDQLDLVLSELGDAKEFHELRTICKVLKQDVQHFNVKFPKALDHVRLLKANMTTELQTELTKLQIEESRQAMAQADTVAKLTILAFIFIPLSTVSGIFGMNVKEITDGTRLWQFGVTAGAVVAVTLALVFGGTALSMMIFGLHRWSRYLWERLPRSQWWDCLKWLTLDLPLDLWRYLGRCKDRLISVKKRGEELRKEDRERRLQKISRDV
ncbi:MAG: hypothetical protein Q9227_009357 [Pyrenula ochraceoflavens]